MRIKRFLIPAFLVLGTLLVLVALLRPVRETEDGTENVYRIAMITDSGGITDRSFNQNTFEACRDYALQHNMEYNYFKPEVNSDYARSAMVNLAVARGYNIIVMPGFLFAQTIVEETKRYPEVKFIALDVSKDIICAAAVGNKYYADPQAYNAADYYNTKNTYCAIYQEEIPGYMAGYMAVKSGYRRLGFLGGEALPAVVRYGYGFLQGINDAAEELGVVDDISVQYAYAGQFYASTELTAAMDTWYSRGTEVVFAAGGTIFHSVGEAAAKAGGKMIGVDNDQRPIIDTYGKGMTVTSAMKKLDRTVFAALDAIIYQNRWEKEYAGKADDLGLISGSELDKNYVGLPDKGTQWSDKFTREDYARLVKELAEKKRTVDSAVDEMPSLKIQVKVRAGTIM